LVALLRGHRRAGQADPVDIHLDARRADRIDVKTLDGSTGPRHRWRAGATLLHVQSHDLPVGSRCIEGIPGAAPLVGDQGILVAEVEGLHHGLAGAGVGIRPGPVGAHLDREIPVALGVDRIARALVGGHGTVDPGIERIDRRNIVGRAAGKDPAGDRLARQVMALAQFQVSGIRHVPGIRQDGGGVIVARRDRVDASRRGCLDGERKCRCRHQRKERARGEFCPDPHGRPSPDRTRWLGNVTRSPLAGKGPAALSVDPWAPEPTGSKAVDAIRRDRPLGGSPCRLGSRAARRGHLHLSLAPASDAGPPVRRGVRGCRMPSGAGESIPAVAIWRSILSPSSHGSTGSLARDVLAYAVLFALVAVGVAWPYLAGHWALAFSDAGGDLLYQYYPLDLEHSRQFAQGGGITWSFRLGLGGYIGTHFDPFMWLQAVFPESWQLKLRIWTYLLKLGLAGLAMVAYLRMIGLHGLPVVLGGLAFAFSDYALINGQWDIHRTELVHFIFLACLLEWFLRSGSVIPGLLIGLMLGFGHPFNMFTSAFFTILYVLARTFVLWDWGSWRKIALRMPLLLLCVVIGILVFAPVQFTLLYYFLDSPRVSGDHVLFSRILESMFMLNDFHTVKSSLMGFLGKNSM